VNLSFLLPLLRETTAYKQVVEQLLALKQVQGKNGHKAVIFEAAKPYFIAALYDELRLPLMVITAQPGKARKLYEQLEIWCPSSADLQRFPELELEGARDVWKRLQVLATLDPELSSGDARPLFRPENSLNSSSPPLIVTSALAIITKTVSPKDFTSACQILRQGMVVEPLNLLRRWQLMGYETEDIVELPGTISKRGGIIDVFSPCSQLPARIEFFGNEIESIRLFNPETQCSTKPINLIAIVPAKEVGPELDSGFENNGSPELSSGLDYLCGNAILILDSPGEIKAAIEKLHCEAQVLPSRACPELVSGERRLFSWEELELKINARRYLSLEPWGITGNGGQPLPFSPPQGYGGKLEKFLDSAKQMIEEKQRVLVVSHQANRLAELFQERGIEVSLTSELKEIPPPASIALLQSSPGQVSGSVPAEGWKMGNLHLITDAELFGFVKQARPSRSMPVRHRWLTPQLASGDYVVHIDHGIGRFRGLIRMKTFGIEREYFVLEYAGNDRLYVPTDQITRISSYIGAGDRAPSLSRLGTQEWERVKKRVKESVADIAQGMLELYASREVNPGFAFSSDTLWQQELEASFPYVETLDQLEAISAVKDDMEKPKSMDRLICGDVGYGKTEVALRAAFKAVMNNKQVAILVPTTVLAQQHFNTFKERLQAFPIRVEMLSRFCSREKEREVLEGLSNGTVDICIGTHRLLQKDIAFRDLGLVIIDEEQRFGVVQKEKLKQIRKEADALTLSATPIPRTLHMSLTGIRDMSIIETPPEERLAIKTYVGPYDEQLVRQAILQELERNGQVFFVHNRIESIALVANKIQSLVPEARIAIAHGRMPEEELEMVMLEFVTGKHDVLLTTTIIESGLDMPNVNTLIIDQADKFGLAQLYQLRGRVGRGSNQAYAYFFFDKDKPLTSQAVSRLRTIFEATELGAGFGIAVKDLEIRGAGNLLGVEQSGYIAAVGFDLYCQLLAEAVEELKTKRAALTQTLSLEGRGLKGCPSLHHPLSGEGREGEAKQSPDISLPLAAFIPEEYVPSLGTRLGLYHRLARIECVEEIEEIARELKDRFGKLPEPLRNLLYIVEIKILATAKGIQSIYFHGQEVILDLAPGRSTPILISRPSPDKGGSGEGHPYKIGTKQIRLDTSRLRAKWQEELRRLLACHCDEPKP